MTPEKIKHALIAFLKKEGFLAVGVAQAVPLEEERERYHEWLARGYSATMRYLTTYDRLDPRTLLPEAKSVVMTIVSYYTRFSQPTNAPKIARYAWGYDYHKVLRPKLQAAAEYLSHLVGPTHRYKIFVDSAPIHERAWAQKAGLGWRGKNTLLIHRKAGSYTFLAGFVTNYAMPADIPHKDFCGSCNRCIRACPTGALRPYVLDARKCISYLTIENPDPLDDPLSEWIFGCDICQEVCPWNRFAQPTSLAAFQPLDHIFWSREKWLSLTATQFRKLTRPTALSRVRYTKWQKNLQTLRHEFLC